MADQESIDYASLVDRFARQSSGLGVQIVDVAGNVSDVAHRLGQQAALLAEVNAQMSEFGSDNQRIAELASSNLLVTKEATAEVGISQKQLKASINNIEALVASVAAQEGLLMALQQALKNVVKVVDGIDGIAKQTNMLALNATIEAATAGDAGRGFLVVAREVKELAKQAADATRTINEKIGQLNAEADRLIQQNGRNAELARSVGAAAVVFDTTFRTIGTTVERIAGGTREISSRAEAMDQRSHSILEKSRVLSDGVSQSNSNVRIIDDRLKVLLNAGEGLIALTAESGVETSDTPFLREVVRRSGEISARLLAAVECGELSMADLLDRNYVKVPGTDPVQYRTRYLELFQKALPPILEQALQLDKHITYCVPVDQNGYCPVHNKKLSLPQGKDPVWNLANCRQMRIYDDKVCLAAAKNLEKFTVQTYRRDMGGGRITVIMDVSSPIFIGSRHWGALRLGYTV